MYESLFKKITAKTTIITVTRRLAVFLNNEYSHYQQQLGNEIWPEVDILPIGQWLERCWHQCQTDFTLLSSAHELALWQQLIRKTPNTVNLLQIANTAKLALQAWQLAKQWQININDTLFNQTEDCLVWQTWAKEFAALSENNYWLDSNSLPDQLSNLCQSQQLQLPEKIILVGFDEINPQYQRLLQTLANCGCSFEEYVRKRKANNIKRLALFDTTTEIERMAHWAYTLWKQNPNTHIGCIIPNLTEIRSEVLNVFSEIFTPTACLPDVATALPFNISASLPLSNYPLIQIAFKILKLNNQTEFDIISQLLRSPFLAYAEQEICSRTQVEIELRQNAEIIIELRQIIVLARKLKCWHLVKLLENYLTILPQKKLKQSPSAWITVINDLLNALGWPGERPLNSSEYQLIERWKELLNEFAKLNLIVQDISFETAWQHLFQLASNTLFQPQSLPVSINILNPLEAAGLQFDYLWIMGLHDSAWPPSPTPNPFLPIELQRKYKIPHASNQQEFHFYNLLTQHLYQSANDIILSYPQFNEDRTLRPSSLILNKPEISQNDLNLVEYITYTENIHKSGLLEYFEDHQAPPLTSTEKFKGGSAIFKYQAACPFRAFARFRLGAQTLPAPQAGLSAKERGSLLHRALEMIWGKLNSHEQLMACSNEQLQVYIQEAINKALLDFIKLRPTIFKERFIQLEKMRLQKLINEWLELEKQRQPFVIHALELTHEVTIADLAITIRADRIDQLADGSYIIFDYKTGLTSTNYWFTDRPEEPQLPLYTIASELPIKGLAFAQLRAHAAQFKGISADEVTIPGVKAIDKINDETICKTWPELINFWRNALLQLGEQFRNGYALGDPKKAAQTCRYCDLHTLCRINETLMAKP